MVKIRAGTLLAAAGAARPMDRLGANALILKSPGKIPTTKGIIISNMPYWADLINAPDGLLAVWDAFSRIAEGTKGQMGKDPNTGWNKTATAIHTQMRAVGIKGTGIGRMKKIGRIRAELARRRGAGALPTATFIGGAPFF